MSTLVQTGARHNKRNNGKPSCTGCRSVAIYQRPSGFWECKLCGETFKKPVPAFQEKKKLKGIKAPISYRAQLAREILTANLKAASCIAIKQSYYGKTN
tara:strand:+ start:256 stop:552 length:297 start_codon:yes stop_codon:yes gene_type:complete